MQKAFLICIRTVACAFAWAINVTLCATRPARNVFGTRSAMGCVFWEPTRMILQLQTNRNAVKATS